MSPPYLHRLRQHPIDQADNTHRQHAICETVWSDLIDGPWAHQPSGSFAANAAWSILAAICHNLLRAAGALTGTARYAKARGATLRAHLINIPARLARPQRRPVLHLPTHWPRATHWLHLWKAVFVPFGEKVRDDERHRTSWLRVPRHQLHEVRDEAGMTCTHGRVADHSSEHAFVTLGSGHVGACRTVREPPRHGY